MDAQTILGLVARWAHILAAITAVGGTIFVRFVVVPTLDEIGPDERASLHAAMRRRWSRIVAGAILFLLLSGLYNITLISLRYQLPRWYMPVFALKFFAAFAIFAIASLLAGKTPAAQQMRQHLRLWLNLNITLAVLVVCLSGVLRTAERVPKVPREDTKPATANSNVLEIQLQASPAGVI